MRAPASILLALSILAAAAQEATISRHSDDPSLGFALSLYTATPRHGNIVISPIAASTALRVLLSGARAETAECIRRGLSLPPDDLTNPTTDGMLADLRLTAGVAGQSGMQTSVWVQKGFETLERFTSMAKSRFAADIASLDIAGSPSEASRQINRWALGATGGTVDAPIAPTALISDSKLVVVSALSFGAWWGTEFDPSASASFAFRTRTGTERPIKGTRAHMLLGFWEDRLVQVVEMPFLGQRFSMFVVLPKPGIDLAECEASLSPRRLAAIMQSVKPTRVALWFPRFQMLSTFEQRDALSRMGMAAIFSPGADFTGIGGPSGLRPGMIFQATRFSFDERGAYRLAATAITKTMDFDEPWTQFRADRPFIFAVRHNASGALLLLGRLEDPLSGGAAAGFKAAAPQPGSEPRALIAEDGYKEEAVGVLLADATEAARSLHLAEGLPLTRRDVTESFILPEAGATAWGAIGMVGTANYKYYASQSNKLCFIVRRSGRQGLASSGSGLRAANETPTSNSDAYALATNLLTSFGADIPRIIRDCRLRITSAPSPRAPDSQPQKIYMVYWQRPGQVGSVASAQVCLPAKVLLQLRVDDPVYNQRRALRIAPRQPSQRVGEGKH